MITVADSIASYYISIDRPSSKISCRDAFKKHEVVITYLRDIQFMTARLVVNATAHSVLVGYFREEVEMGRAAWGSGFSLMRKLTTEI